MHALFHPPPPHTHTHRRSRHRLAPCPHPLSKIYLLNLTHSPALPAGFPLDAVDGLRRHRGRRGITHRLHRARVAGAARQPQGMWLPIAVVFFQVCGGRLVDVLMPPCAQWVGHPRNPFMYLNAPNMPPLNPRAFPAGCGRPGRSLCLCRPTRVTPRRGPAASSTWDVSVTDYNVKNVWIQIITCGWSCLAGGWLGALQARTLTHSPLHTQHSQRMHNTQMRSW